jgi:hypothetical protein
MSYVLDLAVHEADVHVDISQIKSDLLLEFKVDGVDQQIPLPPCTPAQHLKWDFTVRLILHLDDISESFIYSLIVTTDADGARVKLGRAKFPLKILPLGRPKKFKFPLMSPQNDLISVADVQMTAWLSLLAPYQSTPDRGPSYAAHKGFHGPYWSAPG